MITKIKRNMDCSAVDSNVRLDGLKKWERMENGLLPFYLCTGDDCGVIFDCNPEQVRRLLKTYNSQKLFFHIEFVSFLNSEGVRARRVSSASNYVLGYRADCSCN